MLVLVLFPLVMWSQNGPGGIGDNSSMGLWLKADGISNLNDGDLVTNWPDYSGNSNDGLSPDDNLNPPEFNNTTKTINGFPVVYFSGNNTELKVPDSDDLDSTNGLYMMSVAKIYQSTDDVNAIVGKRKTYGSDIDEYAYAFFYWNGDNLYLDVNTNNERFNTSTAYNYEVTRLQGFEFDGSRPESSRSQIIVNNSVVETGSNTSTSIKNSPRDLIIGSMNHNYGKYTEMDLAELIIFQRALNEAEHNIVNNALSAKYDIAVSVNDLYTGDLSSNGDYDYDVIGIGKESDGDHQLSKSAGIEIVSNTGLDNTGDYLFAGHNTKSNSIVDTGGVAGVDKTWERVWYFNKTDAGNALNINLTFDFNEADLNTVINTSDPNNFHLITKAPGGGNWTAQLTGASSINGEKVSFNDVSITDGNIYTLGIVDPDDNVLPVELVALDAKQQKENVVIEWTTASEINNDYFQIQRSGNGEDYQNIGMVEGNGNSNQLMDYRFVDKFPMRLFNYYRINQVDFNGDNELHGPVVVHFNSEEKVQVLNLDNHLKINLNKSSGQLQVKLYDLNGKIRYTKETSGNNVVIPTGKLNSGIYIVQVDSDDNLIRKKIYID